MILLNAVYFKGRWVYPFEKFNNQDLPFFNFGREKKIIETMIQEDSFNYYEDKEVKIIELPFEEDFMSAIIILPSENIEINLFIEKSNLNQLIHKLDYAKVHLELPKFELDFSENLNEVMKRLGMERIFDYEKANLSGLCEGKNLFVSSIVHKTYLKVNETGTEAAAVTAVVLEMALAYDREEIIHSMKVNRPFLFLLKNSRFPEGYDMVFMAKIEKIDEN